MKNEIMGKRTTWADVHNMYKLIYFDLDGERCFSNADAHSTTTSWVIESTAEIGFDTAGQKVLPLLRRLESITLDEQKDLAIATGWELDQWDAVFAEGDLTTNICEEHPLTYLDRFVGHPKAILWLLDNHFCLWEELFEYGEVGELQA